MRGTCGHSEGDFRVHTSPKRPQTSPKTSPQTSPNVPTNGRDVWVVGEVWMAWQGRFWGKKNEILTGPSGLDPDGGEKPKNHLPIITNKYKPINICWCKGFFGKWPYFLVWRLFGKFWFIGNQDLILTGPSGLENQIIKTINYQKIKRDRGAQNIFWFGNQKIEILTGPSGLDPDGAPNQKLKTNKSFTKKSKTNKYQ